MGLSVHAAAVLGGDCACVVSETAAAVGVSARVQVVVRIVVFVLILQRSKVLNV